MHGVGGVAQEREPAGIGPRYFLQQRTSGGVAAGARHAPRHLAASFRGRRQDEIGGADGWNFHV
jgi:hypothetical protein